MDLSNYYVSLSSLEDSMFYDDSDDLDDPTMDSISSPVASPTPRIVDTPVLPSEWDEDMLPVRVVLNPESHLEFK